MEFERLIKAVAGVLDIRCKHNHTGQKFADDLGADSLDVLEIVMGIEDEFGIKIPTNGDRKYCYSRRCFEAIKKVMNK